MPSGSEADYFGLFFYPVDNFPMIIVVEPGL